WQEGQKGQEEVVIRPTARCSKQRGPRVVPRAVAFPNHGSLFFAAAAIARRRFWLCSRWTRRPIERRAPLQSLGGLDLEVARPGLVERTVPCRPAGKLDARETPFLLILGEALPLVLIVGRQRRHRVATRQLVEHLGEATVGIALPLVPGKETLHLFL